MRHLLLHLLLGVVVFASLQTSTVTVAYAETVLFGPTEYTTSWAGILRPGQVFTAPAPSDGIIKIEKITPGKKLQAGHIFLNRKHYSLNKFLRSTDLIYEIPIQLAEKNRFLLALGGKKGAVLRLAVVGQYGPEILSFSAEPTTIREGETTILTWATQDADSVTISPGVGQVPISGTSTISPTVTTSYTLLASNSSGSSDATSSITVLPKPPTISLTVDQVEITKNETATLSWQVENADNVSLDQGIGIVSATGSIRVSPPSTSTYTLTAENLGGTTKSSVVITIVPLKIFITEPQNMATVSPKVAVQGYLSTEATYANVAVNGQRAIVEDRTFFINEIELAAGDNEITAIVSDSDQNQATATIGVFVDSGEPEITLAIGDPIAFAPYNTTLKAILNLIEIAPDSAILSFDGPGDVESRKINDTEFELTFTTPGLYIISYSMTASDGTPHNAEAKLAIKAPFAAEDWQAMQYGIANLEEVYHNLVDNSDIDTVRQQVLDAARANPDFSSAALSGSAICLVYKGLIPFILDLPDPNGPVTD